MATTKKPTPTPAPTTPVEAVKTNAVITFHGEGADKIKFTVDPKAKTIDVYADGTIVTNY